MATTQAPIAAPTHATIAGKYEYSLFILSGMIDKELDKIGDEGWIAFGFVPQPPGPTGAQNVLVPCYRPKRVIASPHGHGVGLLSPT